MKNKSLYWIVGIVIVILAVGFVSFSNNSSMSGEKQIVKIGLSIPLTGGLAVVGEPAKAAVEMAIEDANKASDKFKYVAIFEDDAFNPTTGVSNAQKLIGVDKVDYLISFGGPVGMAIAPIAEQNKIVHINDGSTPDVAGVGYYNFRHWTSVESEVEKMIVELKRTNITTIALLDANHEGFVVARNLLVEQLKSNNIKVVSDEQFNVEETDFRALWSKVESAKPDLIYFGAQSPEFEIALKQRKELGYTTRLTTIETPLYSAEPELFNGYWFIDAAQTTPTFANEFKERTGKNIFAFTGNAYDIVMTVAKVYEKEGKKLTAEQLADGLLNLGSYSGAMGTFTIDSKGDYVTEATIADVIDGKVVYR